MLSVRIRIVAVTALLLGLSACASSPAPPTQTPNQLFMAYIQSTTVKNDQYRGSTSADRMAEFAAEGTPSDVESAMFTAHQCESSDELGCPPNGPVAKEMAQFAGYNPPFRVQTLLIRHQGGQLELMPLYVVANAAGASGLIDTTGRLHSGGMPDFQQHNTLLTADDVILAPDNITATSGTLHLVVIPGHTATGNGTSPWVIVVIAVLIVVVATTLVLTLVRVNRRRHADPQGTDPMIH